MDELFCDQTRAYGADSAAEDGPPAVVTYEQLKEACEQVGRTLADDEELLVTWHGPGGEALAVEQIGYHQQSFLVLCGRDAAGDECTALVPTRAVQIVLKKVKRRAGAARSPVSFIGHAVIKSPPAAPDA